MRPILFEIAGFAVPSYGAFLALGFAAGIALAAWRAPKIGVEPVRVLDLGLVILVSSIVGSRLFFVATHWSRYASSDQSWAAAFLPFGESEGLAFDGMSVMGGLPLALATSALTLWARGLPLLATMDLCAPSVALGAGITRIGCFLNGCCFGDRCPWPVAVRFPQGSLAAEALPGVAVHPTQLYQSAAGFLIFAGLLVLARRPPFSGAVVSALCVLMGLQRLAAEMVRHQTPSELLQIGAVSVSVYVPPALALVVVGAAPWLLRRRAGLRSG